MTELERTSLSGFRYPPLHRHPRTCSGDPDIFQSCVTPCNQTPLQQIHRLETGVAVFADDDVVVQQDVQRGQDVCDSAGHVDIRL